MVARLKPPPRILGSGVGRQSQRRDESAAFRLTRPHLSHQFVAILERHSDVRHRHIGTPFIQYLKRFGGDPVKLFVMGENRWMTAASYPPPGQPKKYFLGSNFALLPDRGDSQQGRDQYVYDPGDPTPSPHMLDDDEKESRYGELLRERKDIVAYRSAPIQDPFKILGPMSAVIYLSSDAPETDIFVRVSEEDPSRGHFLLAEGIRGSGSRGRTLFG